MNYLLILSIAFILFSYSNFINLIFRIKLNETFLIAICSIIIFSYFLVKLNIYFNLTILDYAYLIILLSAFLFLPIILKNNSKINKKLNLEFLFIFLLIFILSKDRYYLDQDEFSYWGVALKNLTQNIDGFNFKHHPEGLNLFRNLFIFFEYNEGNIIFSNNLILISGFYYLFYDRKLIFFEKFFLFTIYYLLLNNLSFGFLSIYSDPILSVFYACLLKKTYFMFKDGNSFKEINFLFILFTILLLNRSAPIYAIFIFYLCVGLFFLNFYDKYKTGIGLFILTIIISGLFILIFLFPYLNHNYPLIISSYFEILFYSNVLTKQLINFFLAPIYFSHFGVTINGIFEIIFSRTYKLFEFQIPIISYVVFLSLFMFFTFKHKKFIIISSLLIIVTYMIIILILKIQLENLHLSAVPRYIGIMILAKFLFLISIVTFHNKLIHKNYFMIFLLFSLFFVTPKKTLGFFVPDKIYYSELSNYNFKRNREKISILSNFKNNFDDVIVIHKKGYSDLTNNSIAGYHTFYHNIIEYEMFPKKTIFLEYEKLHLLKETNSLIILFDLPSKDISKINTNNNFYKINTY
ncbi:hypothetical protein [Candidatus Pelagibacter communis]|uniref:hypothetical protein n=1 Tax=Pelagibacter ubique TaxID=198252 RepID=UPI000423F14C|nr:hypothetical protein [Candidatus Pelagibacter ubique]